MPSDGYELALSFVSVQSSGGPHDDTSYVCGWEMGALDTYLMTTPLGHEQTIHEVNVEQADLIAMRRGFEMTSSEIVEDGWVAVSFRYVGDGLRA